MAGRSISTTAGPRRTGVLKTVRNLREVSPTWYFNLPAGYDALIPHLEADPDLARTFFSRLKMMWYAGASLAQPTWDRIEKLAVATTGERILIGTGLGATETAPAAVFCLWPEETAGNVGLPIPGLELKLVPMEGKYDSRLRGPSVMDGYWRRPDLSSEAFDEEGYYRFGDALKFVDPDDVSKGLMFDGRTAENFKLDTGTWVTTGPLRVAAMDHFAGLIREIALAGPDRTYLSALIFPRDPAEADDPAYRAEVLAALKAFAAKSTGSSTKVVRALIVPDAPSQATHELTDKGSLNQRRVLANRADLVEEIYAGSDRVLDIRAG